EYTRMLRDFRGHAHYLDSLTDQPVIPDQWQLERLAIVGLSRELFFFTPGICSADLGALTSRIYADLPTALTEFLSGLPPRARIALIPEGPYTFARLEEESLATA
ncbi:MAG TPA: hypothetical protein VII58_14445, partial [Acidobacteriaceae bacterium]